MKTTQTILDKIVAAKQNYLREQRQRVPESQLLGQLKALAKVDGPGFFETLKSSQPQPKIIAEIKRASPSAGTLRESFDLPSINNAYQAADNVVAISVITEHDFFTGSDDDLTYVAQHNTQNKPILRKDFIIDPYQILETKVLGADAFLLIAALFTAEELATLVAEGIALDLEPLVEVTNEEELQNALSTKATCIGVNSRNLKTFTTDVQGHSLLSKIPKRYARIAESGIDSADYLREVSAVADAALIGSYFMRSDNISEAIEKISYSGVKV